MHPADCPGWEYKYHPQKRDILVREVEQLVLDLKSGSLTASDVAADSRPIHLRLFEQLTPDGYEYFAGHYRGEDFRCLRYCPVFVGGDPRVGAPPERVEDEMREFWRLIGPALKTLDDMINAGAFGVDERCYRVVRLACEAFVAFLTTHPYVNGNGHTARFLVWAILGRFGYWPRNWPVEPRPSDPPYSSYISSYRSGDTRALERFLFQSL